MHEKRFFFIKGKTDDTSIKEHKLNKILILKYCVCLYTGVLTWIGRRLHHKYLVIQRVGFLRYKKKKICHDKNARSEAEMSGSERDEYDEQVKVSASPDKVLSSFSCNACSSNFLSESFLSSSSIFSRSSSSVGSSTVHELQRRDRVSIKPPKKTPTISKQMMTLTVMAGILPEFLQQAQESQSVAQLLSVQR